MKRFLAIMLCTCMLLTCMPMPALATETTTHNSHSVCSCAATDAASCSVNHSSSNQTWYAWESGNSLPAYNSIKIGENSPARYYYLTEDVVLTEAYSSSGLTYICLNGHSITAPKGIIIRTDFYIVDCQAAFNDADELISTNCITGQISVNSDGKLRLNGVSVSGHTSTALVLAASTNAAAWTNYAKFAGNATAGAGGAIIAQSGSTIEVHNSVLANNVSAGNGGAIYAKEATVKLFGTTVTECKTTADNTRGGALYSEGGTVTIQNCIFSNCSSKRFGGAIMLCDFSSAVNNTTISSTLFSNCSATNELSGSNSDASGGAIFSNSKGGSLTIKDNSEFVKCSAKTSGGAVYVYRPTTNISDSSLEECTAGTTGGALFAHSATVTCTGTSYGNNSASAGGAIELNNAVTLHLNNCQFTGNSAANGNSINVSSNSALTMQGSVTMSNTNGNDIAMAAGKYATLAGEATTISVSKGDLYLDLAGYDVGTLTMGEGTLYGLDSKTNDYNCDDADGYGTIAVVNGTVASNSNISGIRYVKLADKETGAVSFHRFYAAITAVAMRPGKAGAGYTMEVSGDQMAVDAMKSYGMTITLKNGDTIVTNSEGKEAVFEASMDATKVTAGEFTKQQLLVDNVLSKDADTENNKARAGYKICVQPVINFGGEDIQLAKYEYTFADIVNMTDEGLAGKTVSDGLKANIKAFLDTYKPADLGLDVDTMTTIAEQ